MSATVVIVSALTGHVAEALAEVGGLMVAGATIFTIGAARLPLWARTRRRQMEGVAARLALSAEASPAPNELAAGEHDSVA